MPIIGENYPASGPFSPVAAQTWGNANFPLGAHFVAEGATFAVFSRNAERILLEIYDQAMGQDARYAYWMVKNPTNNIWRLFLRDVPSGTLYGFRCWGPNWPFTTAWERGGSGAGFLADVDARGHRFNPNKLLFDPYARELSHDLTNDTRFAEGIENRLFATGSDVYNGRPQREHDTGHWAPKAFLLPVDNAPIGTRPRYPKEKAVIYEAHVRGLTQHPSASRLPALLAPFPDFAAVQAVPEHLRGTYAGAAYLAPYLAALGFSAIELLPIHESDNDGNPNDHSGGNYWGYMSVGFFAPDRRYAADKSPGGPTSEFKAMVKSFHDAGIEVYIDVVYNHSGEAINCKMKSNNGEWVTLRDVVSFTSLAGFDVTEYYVLTQDNLLEEGATGCGNQLNFSRKAPQQLVIDSLVYWIEHMGVDGFRFDLALGLGRQPDNAHPGDREGRARFFSDHPLLKNISDLGRIHEVNIIAEAWDMWGYEVGKFPADWCEWNDRYRDVVREFLKGGGNTDAFVKMVNGDNEKFSGQGGPKYSVNFVTAHDGFTLADLVSYRHKCNDQAWPFGPSDGGNDDNRSWDSSGDHALRRQRARNFWTVLAFSRGVPMVLGGDEFGRTQNGNNNAYNIDGVGSWHNYDMIATNHPHAVATGGDGAYHDNFGIFDGPANQNGLFAFVHYLLGVRQASCALKQRKYADLKIETGNDVTYEFRREDGKAHLCEGNRCVWLRIDGSAVGDNGFLLFVNAYCLPVTFNFPANGQERQWARIIDTAHWAESHANLWHAGDADLFTSGTYKVAGHAIAVFREV